MATMKSSDVEVRALSKRHAFGIKSDVHGSLNWLDDHTLIYPVGRNVVMHNVQSNAQKFFLTSEKAESISAIALSPNKKFIAIAESGEQPQIQIVDTTTRKRRKILKETDLGSDRIVAMSFSADGRHLATQGGAPQWSLVYWKWESSKSLAKVQVTRDQALQASRDAGSLVTQVTINPRDPLHIVVSGNGLFRFYRFSDGELKHMAGGLGKAHTQNFTTHAWITDERIVVATESADLLLIEEGDFRCPLPAAPSDNHSIYSIVPTSRGFVCGGAMGIISIFEKCEDKELYRRVRSLNIESKLGGGEMSRLDILSFCLTQGEDTLVMATSTLQIVALNFNVDWSKSSETPVFRSICQPFHAKSIVGLDCCVRKPLVATSSTDKTVRIWNTQENVVETVKLFQNEPGAIALHPSGLHILVTFHDKVKFMNIYGDNIQEFKSFNVRQATDVRFSTGGQYFAVVHGSVICIYNTATCDSSPIAQFKGHSQKIKNIQWASVSPFPTDTRLVSCGTDGMVIDWNIQQMRKEGEHIDKQLQYHAVASDDKIIVVAGAPSPPSAIQGDSKFMVKLREIEPQMLGSNSSAVSNEYVFPDLFITTLALASYDQKNRYLFGGCSDGSVKLMKFPLQGGVHDPPILAHSSSVTKICLSHDKSMLFTVSNDGSFFIFDIKEDGRSFKRETAIAEEILISKTDLEEKNATAAHLRQMLEEFKTDLDGEEKRETHQHGTEIKECTENFKLASAANAERFGAAWNSKIEQERNHAEQKREIAEKHRRNIDALEKRKQAELQSLDELCRKRRQTIDSEREAFVKDLQQCDETYERKRRENEEEFQEKLNNQQLQLRQKNESLQQVLKTQEEIRHQLELDTDSQIESTRTGNEEKLKNLIQGYMTMKGERAIMIKNLAGLHKEIDHRQAEQRALENAKQNQNRLLNALEATSSSLKSDIDERDSKIGEKEKKIYELKKRNQDLEKHKFVLDHRIRQLKSQIEPKQMEIAKENEKIKLKDAELEQFQRNNLALRSTIEELKEKINHQQSETKRLLNKLKDLDTYKSRVRTDVGELAQLIQEPELLREGVNRLYLTHVVNRGGQRCASLESDVKEEFNAHTAFLSKTVDSLKRKVAQDSEMHKKEVSNVMMENLALLKEIHELRKEVKLIRNSFSTDAAQPQTTSSSNNAPSSLAKEAALKEIEANRSEMQRLRTRIEELEKSLAVVKAPRPPSSQNRLPPVRPM